MRQDGLSPRPRVATDQALDVDRGPRHEALQRLHPAHVLHPMLYAELLLHDALVETARGFGHHRLLARRQGTGLLGIAVDGRVVAVGGDEGRQRLDQVPGRAVHSRLVAGMNVLARTATPALPARQELALD